MKRFGAWVILATIGVVLSGCFVEEDGGRRGGYGYHGGGYGYGHHYYNHDYYH